MYNILVRKHYKSFVSVYFQASKIMKGCKGDASELKPTLMACVPVSVLYYILNYV